MFGNAFGFSHVDYVDHESTMVKVMVPLAKLYKGLVPLARGYVHMQLD